MFHALKFNFNKKIKKSFQILLHPAVLISLAGLLLGAIALVGTNQNNSTNSTALASTAAPTFSWDNVPYGGMGFVTGVQFHPTDSSLLYARTDVGGVYRWDTGAGRWIPLTDRLPTQDSAPGIVSLAIDKLNKNVIYMATGGYLGSDPTEGDGNIFKSSDKGSTWQALNPKTSSNNNIRMDANTPEYRGGGERLAVDPNNSQILYYASNQDGLFRSQDAGQSWQSVSTPSIGQGNTGIAIVTFDPSSQANGKSQKIYLAIPGSGTYRSNDGGNQWNLISGGGTGYPYRAQIVNGIYYQSYTDKNWSPINGGLWKLDGNTWTNISPSSSQQVTGFAVSPVDPNTIYVERVWPDGNTTNSMAKTTNGGQTWTRLYRSVTGVPAWYNNQIPVANKTNPTSYMNSDVFYISSLIMDPNNPNRLLRSDGWAVYETNDITQATSVWNWKNHNLEELVVNVVKKAPGKSLYSGVWDVGGFGSPNYLQTPVSRASNFEFLTMVTGGDYFKGNPDLAVMVGGNQNFGEMEPAIFKTTDGGVKWTTMRGPAGASNGNIAISSNDSNNMVWMARTGSGDWDDWSGKIFYTKNGGSSWAESKGIGQGTILQSIVSNNMALVSDQQLPNTFYQYQCSPSTNWNRVFFASNNGGATFTKKVDDWTEDILPCSGGVNLKVNPKVAGQVWFSCTNDDCSAKNLRYSPDGGANWNIVSGIDEVSTFAFGAPILGSSHMAVYADGTVNGVYGIYVSPDASSLTSNPTWYNISGANNFSITSIDADTSEPGLVFLGTGGRGVVYGKINTTPVSSSSSTSILSSNSSSTSTSTSNNSSTSASTSTSSSTSTSTSTSTPTNPNLPTEQVYVKGRNFSWNKTNGNLDEVNSLNNYTQINCNTNTVGNNLSFKNYTNLCNTVVSEANGKPIFTYFFRYELNCGDLRSTSSNRPGNSNEIKGFANYSQSECSRRNLSDNQKVVFNYLYFTYQDNNNNFVDWFVPQARSGQQPLGWIVWGE